MNDNDQKDAGENEMLSQPPRRLKEGGRPDDTVTTRDDIEGKNTAAAKKMKAHDNSTTIMNTRAFKSRTKETTAQGKEAQAANRTQCCPARVMMRMSPLAQ